MALSSLYTRIRYTVFLISCYLILIPSFLQAQVNYPVMATVQLNPPFSLYLSDYAAPDLQRMQVHLLMKDLTETNYRCRLQITIEGFGVTLRSKNAFYTAPILLNGGEMITLSGPDLAPYLNPQNLLTQGLDYNEFIRNGSKLPEGIYKFTVTVLDYTRNNIISNTSFAIVSTFLSYPPIINLPMANAKVDAYEPQNIFFQWVPRHTASINAAFNVAYKFRLVELIPADRDPNDAMRTTRPILETMIAQTMYVYGPADPALIPGHHYAVQIQAIEAEGKDMFINNGFSEVIPFIYGEKCGLPTDVMAAVASSSSLKLSWTGLPSQQAFTVRYREAGDNPSQWYEETTYVPQLTITGLIQGKKYEYQVNGQCFWGYGDYTEMQSFTMPDAALTKGDFVCGRPGDGGGITNREDIGGLNAGDVITTGDFKVEIEKTEGAKGSWSGSGKISVPFLNYVILPVVFKNISVNTDKRMYAGVIELERDNAQTVSDNMNTALNNLLDKISNVVQTSDTNGLKLIDAAGLIAEIDRLKGWDELDTATKDKLSEIQAKLKEAQALQEAIGMTPEEKATMADKIAKDLKKLVDDAKQALAMAKEILKELLGLFRKAAVSLRNAKVDDIKLDAAQEAFKKADEAAKKMLEGLESSAGNIVKPLGEIRLEKPDLKIPEELLKRKKMLDEYNRLVMVYILGNNTVVEDDNLVIEKLDFEGKSFKDFLAAERAGKVDENEIQKKIETAVLQFIEKIISKK